MEHATQCPMHEDNEIKHDCDATKRVKSNPVIWDNNWLLYMGKCSLAIDYCPFCGEELPIISCKCQEIKEGLKERELDIKSEGKL